MAAARKSAGKPAKAAKKAQKKKSPAKKNYAAKKAAGESGSRSGAKKALPKKTASKKAAAKKNTVKKNTAKKSATKKAASKKFATKKTAKTSARAVEKAPAARKKAPVKKALAKKAAARKATVQKPAIQKTVAARLTKIAVRPPRTAQTARARRDAKPSHAPAAANRRLAARTPVGRSLPRSAIQPADAAEMQQLRQSFNPADLVVRHAEASDYQAIAELLLNSFPGTADAALIEALRSGGDVICEMVGDYCGVLTGHAGFVSIEAQIEGQPVRAAALAPLTVEGNFRTLGIARRLIAAGVAEARRWGAEGVFAVGDAEYFAQFGFSNRLAQRFSSPYPGASLNALEFAPGALAGPAGVLTYPPAFEGKDAAVD